MSPEMTAPSHTPVLLEEAIQALAVQPGGRYVDCTVGGGGHAAAILDHSSPGGQLLGLDADPEATEIARVRLGNYGHSTLIINENFANLQAICYKYDFLPVHGILFDLGLSSLQISGKNRGFSFQHDGPLDMRLNPSQDTTAADIVNTSSEAKLANLIRTYGEERYSHRIARHIVKERPMKTTIHLTQTIEQALGSRRGKIHPATRTFQALRIAINQELNNLEAALKQAIEVLGFEGRLVVISYHSLEDRIVKQFMQQESKDCICPPHTPVCVCKHKTRLNLINKKAITPSPSEVQCNPRSRSAKLRVAERTIIQDDCYHTVGGYALSPEIGAEGWRRPALLKKLRLVFSTA